jgi:hypothetical protein
MADAAAHLVDRVLPRAPYRQGVFTVPKPLRLVLARGDARRSERKAVAVDKVIDVITGAGVQSWVTKSASEATRVTA